MPRQLLITNHSRDIAGLKYIYPVISRRAGGLSIGVNFNPNNACNWRCIYCQVPNLKPGNAPEMDLGLLSTELTGFLDYVRQGAFFADYNIDPALRFIKDIAISGNGEPTSLKNFPQAVSLIAEVATQAGIFPVSKFVLISNGSLIHQEPVQAGLAAFASHNGELWLKLDSATPSGRKRVNNTGQSQDKLLENIGVASKLCAVKLQTCMLHFQDKLWTENEKQAYLQLLEILREREIPIREIMLYSIARQSFQPEAEQLTVASVEEMNAFAAEIAALGYKVSVSS